MTILKFPLMKLPTVALEVTYKVTHPAVLYHLSKMSRNMHISVKSLCRFVGNQYNMKVQLSPDSNVFFVAHGGSGEEGIGIEKTSATRPQLDGITEAKMAAEYSFDLFHLGDFRVRMSSDLETNSSNVAFEWIVKNQERLSGVVCFGDGPTDDQRYQRCLTAFQRAPNVRVSAKAANSFQMTEQVNTDALSIDHARWITIDTLSFFTCRVLLLLDHGLSNEDLNTFLKDMQSGIRVHPNISTLLVRKTGLEINELLANIDENKVRFERGFFRAFPETDVFSVLDVEGETAVHCFESESNQLQFICFNFPQYDWSMADN